MYEKKPWLNFYGSIPESLEYPEITMYESVDRTARKKSDVIAYDFFGFTSTYGRLMKEIDSCADALSHLGLKKGDTITISMPTMPQGVISFYAANKIGAVASMIHPLSTPKEIAHYLNLTQSRFALTLDAFYRKFKAVMEKTPVEKLILSRMIDYLPFIKKIGFNLTMGRKIPKVPPDEKVVYWKPLLKGTYPKVGKADTGADDLAVIMFSGGTTGSPKGIMLSNRNFISQGLMISAWGNLDETDSILAILPIFHGFGLGVCVNAIFMGGGKSILVPKFSPEETAKLIKTKKPTFLIGVPTLFEALNRSPLFQKTDLSCLKGAFCGADQLPRVMKERFEYIVRKQGGDVQLREGYGLTEAVSAVMAMPLTEYRENSVGIPFSDTMVKIADPLTHEEVPVNEEGEICINSPAVMMGYYNNHEETEDTLIKHEDGLTWLHTGDIGVMDKDGFVYFKLRRKRMIKSSGMNVYPAQVEDVLYEHPLVKEVCVIGVPDDKQVEKVKAFVVLDDADKQNDETKHALIKHCRENLIKWSCPREVEFRDSLPLTLIGKVAFNALEKEEAEKREKMKSA